MSKAKQEADRIVKLFYPLTYTAAIIPYSNQDALRCALIHVEGIIKSNPTYIDFEEIENEREDWVVCDKPFWQEVKQELNKMI